MKVCKKAVIVMVLAFSSVLWAQGVSKASLNFAVNKAATLRCRIRQSSHGPWLLTVLARNTSRHIIFNYLYSVRPDVKKSMKECQAWMKAVKKKQKVAKRLKKTAPQLRKRQAEAQNWSHK